MRQLYFATRGVSYYINREWRGLRLMYTQRVERSLKIHSSLAEAKIAPRRLKHISRGQMSDRLCLSALVGMRVSVITKTSR